MRNYYFLGALLQELDIEKPLGVVFEELMDILRENLSAKDLLDVTKLLKFFETGSLKEEEMKDISPFLHSLMDMEKNLKRILIAIRAKEWNLDVMKEPQEESECDFPLFIEKDPLPEFSSIKILYETHCRSPWDLQKALFQWRWDIVQKMEGDNPFSMQRILGYTARLILKEQQKAIDNNQYSLTTIKEI